MKNDWNDKMEILQAKLQRMRNMGSELHNSYRTSGVGKHHGRSTLDIADFGGASGAKKVKFVLPEI